MILNPDSNPNRQLYYLGACLLETFHDRTSVDFFEAYQELKKNHEISMQLFILTVDWLYLLGAVKSERGALIKCF